MHLDWESKSDVSLITQGLDLYSAHESTRLLMGAYHFGDNKVKHWDAEDRMPAELRDALLDPHVEKWAFNAQFERVMTRRVAKIKTPITNWRCTMALAYMQSFFGGLDQVAKQVGLPLDKQKSSEGKYLINLFCMPQKITAKNKLLWRDKYTNPDEWRRFEDYNDQDVVSETAVYDRLIRFPILPEQWALYELDQKINDRGLPINMEFVRQAIIMSDRRKAELVAELKDWTGLANPNSPSQLTTWLKKRGYPFDDLQKDTVKKVLKEMSGELSEEVVAVLNLRRQSARTSVKKYDAFQKFVGPNDRFRFAYQYAGASRTNRFAGRKVQTHNLSRTPKNIEPDGDDDSRLITATNAILHGEYDFLGLYVEEPMDALSGLVRSAIWAPDGQEIRACDLSSIETVVIAWLSGCESLMNVFREGRCAYREFGTFLYNKDYDQITKGERTNSKPAVLGCGFRLGGGKLDKGKRTGLWGYAEAMGVDMPQDEATKAVEVYREKYSEVADMWKTLENAVMGTIRTGRDIQVGPVTITLRKPYLMIRLPSGRYMYYYQPRIETKEYIGRPTDKYPEGEPYTRKVFSYMGKGETGAVWMRIASHGGKIIENIVQAIAFDLLGGGLLKADEKGFNVIGHVHDEIKTLQDKDDEEHTNELLRECMIDKPDWAATMPVNAVAGSFDFYRKD